MVAAAIVLQRAAADTRLAPLLSRAELLARYRHLREISKPFADLADIMMKILPNNPESTTAMRKLLEAKDCAVRAKLYKFPEISPKALEKD